MFLKMRVDHEGHVICFDMPVGDGKRTFKWLAFYHPDKTVCEELEDGETVSVILTNNMLVDPIGNPDRDRWMFIAFCTSDSMQEKRTEAIKEELRMLESIRKQKEDETAAKAAVEAEKKGKEMRRIISSQLYSSDKIEQAFMIDWASLTGPPQHCLNNITQDPNELSEIKKVVLSHYLTIVEVFKTYASVGSGIATGDMDIMEFSAFIHDLKGPSIPKSRDVVEKLFNEAVSVRRGVQGKTPAIEDTDFVYALIKLACIRHHVPGHTSTEQASKFRLTGEGGGNRIQYKDSHAEAVEVFLEEVVVPLGWKKLVGLQIKKAMATNEVLALLFDYHPLLHAVFNHYSSKAVGQQETTQAGGELLTIAEFTMILKDAGLLGGNNKEDDELTSKEVRQAFAGAQNELCGGDGACHHAARFSELLEQMVYPEFLEGIARVALLKWEDQLIPIKDKVLWAAKSVASLPLPGQAS